MFESQSAPRPQLRRVVRVLLVACVSAAPLALWLGARSYRDEARLFGAQRHRVALPAEARGCSYLQNVAFEGARGVPLRGWYVPSRNRAGVVIAHGSGGDRRDGIAEASVLRQHGFGVLLFDFPGHGE